MTFIPTRVEIHELQDLILVIVAIGVMAGHIFNHMMILFEALRDVGLDKSRTICRRRPWAGLRQPTQYRFPLKKIRKLMEYRTISYVQHQHF